MNEIKTYKRLTWGLVALNILIVVFFVFLAPPHPPRLPHNEHHPEGPKERIETQLNLSEQQKHLYHDLIKQHIDQVHEQDKKITALRQELYNSHFHQLQTQSIESNLCQAISDMELINIDHLKEIRNICNAEQQKTFDEMAVDWALIFTHQPPTR
jgi:hypothetical protein